MKKLLQNIIELSRDRNKALNERTDFMGKASKKTKLPKDTSITSKIDAYAKSMNLLADLVTALWRARSKMLDAATGQPLETMKRAYRDLQSAWDILPELGFEIYDPINEPFDSGRENLVVKAFQPSPGLRREIVIETIKPAIYLRNDLIQLGEVFVGTPELPDMTINAKHSDDLGSKTSEG